MLQNSNICTGRRLNFLVKEIINYTQKIKPIVGGDATEEKLRKLWLSAALCVYI